MLKKGMFLGILIFQSLFATVELGEFYVVKKNYLTLGAIICSAYSNYSLKGFIEPRLEFHQIRAVDYGDEVEVSGECARIDATNNNKYLQNFDIKISKFSILETNQYKVRGRMSGEEGKFLFHFLFKNITLFEDGQKKKYWKLTHFNMIPDYSFVPNSIDEHIGQYLERASAAQLNFYRGTWSNGKQPIKMETDPFGKWLVQFRFTENNNILYLDVLPVIAAQTGKAKHHTQKAQGIFMFITNDKMIGCTQFTNKAKEKYKLSASDCKKLFY